MRLLCDQTVFYAILKAIGQLFLTGHLVLVLRDTVLRIQKSKSLSLQLACFVAKCLCNFEGFRLSLVSISLHSTHNGLCSSFFRNILIHISEIPGSTPVNIFSLVLQKKTYLSWQRSAPDNRTKLYSCLPDGCNI